jgi:glucokinase
MKVIGIDIGGTSIKCGFVDQQGAITNRFSFPIDKAKSQDDIVEQLIESIEKAIADSGLPLSDIKGVGIGCPGSINSTKGTCDYSNNLGWANLAICEKITHKTHLKAAVANDANCAVLGEVLFGAGKGYKDLVMLTLGTGVGSGLYLNGSLYEGNEGKGAELGHTLLVMNGRSCTCGRKGCLEAYCSATALIADTKTKMKENPTSAMWDYCEKDLAHASGRTAFECAKKGDKAAQEVVDAYISYLGEGLLNITSAFRPEAIVLGGGLSGQKDALIRPLVRYLEERDYGFGGKHSPKVALYVSSLGNDAGILGAAALLLR